MNMDEISRYLGQIRSRAGDNAEHNVTLSDNEMAALRSAIRVIRMQ